MDDHRDSLEYGGGVVHLIHGVHAQAMYCASCEMQTQRKDIIIYLYQILNSEFRTHDSSPHQKLHKCHFYEGD